MFLLHNLWALVITVLLNLVSWTIGVPYIHLHHMIMPRLTGRAWLSHWIQLTGALFSILICVMNCGWHFMQCWNLILKFLFHWFLTLIGLTKFAIQLTLESWFQEKLLRGVDGANLELLHWNQNMMLWQETADRLFMIMLGEKKKTLSIVII